jgi:hypothetical protein
MLTSFIAESYNEYVQDIVLGIIFLCIALFSLLRLRVHYYNYGYKGKGKVITAFNLLIFCAALIRSIWFLIPSDVLEGSYIPRKVSAYRDEGWYGILISEVLLSFGSISLFSIFILLSCYWSHQLKKVDTENSIIDRELLGGINYQQHNKRLGVMATFCVCIGTILGLEIINITLFLFQIYNSEIMLLYDSIMLTILSLIVLFVMTVLSKRLRLIMTTIGAINSSSTRPKIRRILAITIAGNVFFFIRVVLECTFAISILICIKKRTEVVLLLQYNYWDTFIAMKHVSEIMVLILELIISTEIKTYDGKETNSSSLKIKSKLHQNIDRKKYQIISSNENIPINIKPQTYN